MDHLKANIFRGKASESNAQALAKELVELQARLDIIQERANRANAEFKGRYARWRAFKEFMETEEQEYKRKAQRLRSEEKTRQRDSYYSKRRQKFQELGLDSDDLGEAEAIVYFRCLMLSRERRRQQRNSK